MAGIVLSDAGYRIGGRNLLSGVTLHLTEPRIGIVGRNGSGKTTLLRLIAGLIAPASGQVSVDGILPWKDRRGALSRLGVLFQNPEHQVLFPTVAEELSFGLEQCGLPRAEARARAAAALQAAGRGHWAGAPVATLSGGQKHWLCLEAILLMAPGTLLLDEPFAGLDLAEAARVRRRLAGLPQQVIMVSHDPATLAGADRVIWLETGRVAMDGPAAGVLAAYRDRMDRAGEDDADTDLAG
jgi:biotin transport system ATP-binding protein